MATDWRDVAKRFGMSRHDVETIENKVHLESDQVERHRAYRMLCKWRISEGDKASLDIVKVELEHVKEQQRTAAFGSKRFAIVSFAETCLVCFFPWQVSLFLMI